MKLKAKDSSGRLRKHFQRTSVTNIVRYVLLAVVGFTTARLWQQISGPSNLHEQSTFGVVLTSESAQKQLPGSQPANIRTVALTTAENDSESDSQDEDYRRRLLGTWEDDYQGHRTMTILEDGTGTMVVELEGIAARLFAPKLTFNMNWSVENGHLRQWTLGGEPAGKVKLVLRTFGDKVNQPILKLTEDRLLLLDKNGETEYDWRRVSR